jgi:hypothetical protein
MKWDTVFFRNLSLTTFDSLNDYFETIDQQLMTVKEGDRKRINGDIKELELDEEQRYAEWDLALQKHTTTYDMLYTNFLHYSFVVLLFLVMNDWLHRLCLAVEDIKNPPNPVPNNLKGYKQYLTDAQVLVDDRLWEVADNLQKVRDCIVHTSGNVSRSRDKKHLRTMAQRKMGIKISSRTDIDDEEPLYLENDMLIIQPAYCKSTISNIKLLIEGLCDKVPLEKFDFKSLFPRNS